MIRLNSRQPIPEALKGGIVALGNFDGFHLGHQAVVGEAIAWARAEGRPAIIATFDPHPVRFFKPDAEPFRLTTLDQRQDLFAAAGADAMLVIEFGADVANMTAREWIERELCSHLGAVGVVTGEDFTFGKGRLGNPAVLSAIAAEFGVETRAVGPVDDASGPVSSSRIRQALKAGDCAEAARMLTRPFAIRGSVQHGDKNGRLLGFPTANLEMGTYLRPRYGIYAVRGYLPDAKTGQVRVLDGAANLGVRPSFDPPRELLEPHFFDFDGDLYGQEIEVAFHQFLRGEAKFDSMDALMAQMERDCDAARAVLAAG
ncbi:MAG: bifunctional riboflavin kinase/FAD synthetase [Novosphingobium sp.]